jgi:hypothetical protein
MYKKVSWSDAFSFYLSLIWRALVFYTLVNIAAAFILIYPLSIILDTQSPAPLVALCSVIALVILLFIMVIPVRNTLQEFVYKCGRIKISLDMKPLKQISPPNYARETVGSADVVVRPGEFSAADEYRNRS